MNERFFTPGPWKAISHPYTGCNTEITTSENPGRGIAGTWFNGYVIEQEANALLIAACPTMYDYIQKKALEGDEDAAKIIASLK